MDYDELYMCWNGEIVPNMEYYGTSVTTLAEYGYWEITKEWVPFDK